MGGAAPACSASASTTCTWATCCARYPSIPTRRSPASTTRTGAGWQPAIASFGIPEDRVFTDLEACLSQTGADLAIVCSATAEHAETVEAIAPHGLNVMVEKPFAASAAEARRMIAAMEGRAAARRQLAARLVSLAQHRQATARRRRDRRADRGALLRRQPRPALPPRRQGRGLAGGGRAAEARLLVVQAGVAAAAACSTTSATAPRSGPGSWRRGAARGHLRRRRDAGHRGRPAFDHRLPLRARPLEVRDALGHADRPLDDPAAAALRFRARRPRRLDLELRLRRLRHAADPRGALAGSGPGRRAPGRAGAARSNTCWPGSPTAGRSRARSIRRLR